MSRQAAGSLSIWWVRWLPVGPQATNELELYEKKVVGTSESVPRTNCTFISPNLLKICIGYVLKATEIRTLVSSTSPSDWAEMNSKILDKECVGSFFKDFNLYGRVRSEIVALILWLELELPKLPLKRSIVEVVGIWYYI